MNEVMKKKYPEIVSLKGTDENKQSDVRVEFDGGKVHGQIHWNTTIFMITPIVYNKRIYYLVYDAVDAPVARQPFEKEGVQPAYDR